MYVAILVMIAGRLIYGRNYTSNDYRGIGISLAIQWAAFTKPTQCWYKFQLKLPLTDMGKGETQVLTSWDCRGGQLGGDQTSDSVYKHHISCQSNVLVAFIYCPRYTHVLWEYSLWSLPS